MYKVKDKNKVVRYYSEKPHLINGEDIRKWIGLLDCNHRPIYEMDTVALKDMLHKAILSDSYTKLILSSFQVLPRKEAYNVEAGPDYLVITAIDYSFTVEKYTEYARLNFYRLAVESMQNQVNIEYSSKILEYVEAACDEDPSILKSLSTLPVDERVDFININTEEPYTPSQECVDQALAPLLKYFNYAMIEDFVIQDEILQNSVNNNLTEIRTFGDIPLAYLKASLINDYVEGYELPEYTDQFYERIESYGR